jgi:hypothetical protein
MRDRSSAGHADADTDPDAASQLYAGISGLLLLPAGDGMPVRSRLWLFVPPGDTDGDVGGGNPDPDQPANADDADSVRSGRPTTVRGWRLRRRHLLVSAG